MEEKELPEFLRFREERIKHLVETTSHNGLAFMYCDSLGREQQLKVENAKLRQAITEIRAEICSINLHRIDAHKVIKVATIAKQALKDTELNIHEICHACHKNQTQDLEKLRKQIAACPMCQRREVLEKEQQHGQKEL